MPVGYAGTTPPSYVKKKSATDAAKYLGGSNSTGKESASAFARPAASIAPASVNPNPTNFTGVNATATHAGGENTSASTTVNPGAQGGSGYDANSTDPFTGFASRYAPGDAATLYQNPQVIANDVLSQMGLNTPGMRQLIGQNADAAFYLAFLLTGQDPNKLGDESQINTMADYFKNQATAGGRAPDYNALIGSLLNPGALDNSALSQYLNVADPSTQVSNMLQLARPALNGINPLAQKAALGYLGDQGDQFLGATAGGNNQAYGGNFGDYLQKHGGLYGQS